MGRSVTRRPVALNTALAMAAAYNDEFGKSFDTKRIGDRVLAGEECGVERRDIGVDGDEIVGEVRVDDAPVPMVEMSSFQQRHTDSAHHAAERLAMCQLGVDDSACVVAGVHAADTHGAQQLVDSDLGEHRAVGPFRVSFGVFAGSPFMLGVKAPQRQMLPLIHSRISAPDPVRPSRIQPTPETICPAVQ